MKSPLQWLASLSQSFLVLAFFTAAQAVSAQPASELLTNAADVISLSAERASGSIKVSVTGVVTAADPTMKGRFFLQDATGGVFVDNVDGRRPEPGDLVEVSGISHAGAYAPIITAPTVKKIGTAPLPLARAIPIDQLISGSEDSQRIEVSGIVRAARIDGPRLIIDLASAGYRFRVYMPIPPDTDPQKLIAAQVRVRGTAAEAHNRSLRQLISVEVYVPLVSDFVVDKPELVNPFEKPVVPLSSVAQYRRDNSFDQRVHVRGTVTLQRLGENLFLQDAMGGGLQVQSRQSTVFAPGEVVEAVGFPKFENFRPVLGDAVLRKTSETPVAMTPTAVSIEELRAGLHHADLISIQGKVIDRTARRLRRQGSDPLETVTVLILQNTNLIFTVEREEPEQVASMAAIPIGSIIEVQGISLTETDDEGKFKALRVLLPTSNSIRILHKPDWLTPQRLLIGLVSVCSILIVIFSWTVMVSQRNSALKSLIREREKAQIELQSAHDMLEERVKERTAQLKFQITARKESELQFKAVLGERTRLAQELHDTLEQTLTGIALQLDTAAKLFGRSPESAIRHLELARNLMSQSQVEVRRSIWDLRCRALEQFDLAGALLRSARQFTHGTGIEIEVETKGQHRPLPEVVEENLLRIGQEALTNVIKHSGAHAAKIELQFNAEKVVLQIRDDGRGFVPENSAGAEAGHFGLLGMSERAKRLDGCLLLTSAPGKGTTVHVEIPLGPIQETARPELLQAQMES